MSFADDFAKMMDDWDKAQDKSEGHIYAVEYDDGIVKIGKTASPRKRMYSLTTFRGTYHKIIRVYISGKVQHSRYCEKKAMAGLVPCYGRECFSIPFKCAINRVRAVAGTDVYFCAEGFDKIRGEFPNIERPEDGLERIFTELLELTKNRSTQCS